MIKEPHLINTLTYLGLDVTTKVGIERVLSTVCTHFNISIDDVKSKNRKGNIVQARHYYCFLASTCFSHFTLAHIGGVINKHHASVLHARTKVYNYIETEPKAAKTIAQLKIKLNQFSSNDVQGFGIGPDNVGWYSTIKRKEQLKGMFL